MADPLHVKYHAPPLFRLTEPDAAHCIDRLLAQARIYEGSSIRKRLRMETRALMVAALTLNATAVWTAKLLEQGRFSMKTQRLFFGKRWRKPPFSWGETAKSALARALSGYSLGGDAVCIDRHLSRLEIAPEDAPAQWRAWFALYEELYGPGEARLCTLWHIRVLEWIVEGGPRPAAWK